MRAPQLSPLTVLRAGLRGRAAVQLVDSCSSDSITQPHGSRVKCSKKQMNPERKGAPSREKRWRPWPTFSPCRSHLHFSGEQPKCSTLESRDGRGEDEVWQRDACVPLVGPAFEPSWRSYVKTSKTIYLFGDLGWKWFGGLLLGRSDIWKQRHSTNAP